jgi:antitoxin HicB
MILIYGDHTANERTLLTWVRTSDSMQAAKLTKLDMAKKMATNGSQLDRVLEPSNVSVQLDTLMKAARALGKETEIKIKRVAKNEAA